MTQPTAATGAGSAVVNEHLGFGGEPVRQTARQDATSCDVLDLTPDRDDLDPIERASIGELRELQLERLRRTLSHVYEHVAQYRAALDEAGVDPDDVGSLDDFARFPFSDEPEDFDDPDSFLTAVGHGSGPGYGDMRDFIAPSPTMRWRVD